VVNLLIDLLDCKKSGRGEPWDQRNSFAAVMGLAFHAQSNCATISPPSSSRLRTAN